MLAYPTMAAAPPSTAQANPVLHINAPVIYRIPVSASQYNFRSDRVMRHQVNIYQDCPNYLASMIEALAEEEADFRTAIGLYYSILCNTVDIPLIKIRSLLEASQLEMNVVDANDHGSMFDRNDPPEASEVCLIISYLATTMFKEQGNRTTGNQNRARALCSVLGIAAEAVNIHSTIASHLYVHGQNNSALRKTLYDTAAGFASGPDGTVKNTGIYMLNIFNEYGMTNVLNVWRAFIRVGSPILGKPGLQTEVDRVKTALREFSSTSGYVRFFSSLEFMDVFKADAFANLAKAAQKVLATVDSSIESFVISAASSNDEYVDEIVTAHFVWVAGVDRAAMAAAMPVYTPQVPIQFTAPASVSVATRSVPSSSGAP